MDFRRAKTIEEQEQETERILLTLAVCSYIAREFNGFNNEKRWEQLSAATYLNKFDHLKCGLNIRSNSQFYLLAVKNFYRFLGAGNNLFDMTMFYSESEEFTPETTPNLNWYLDGIDFEFSRTIVGFNEQLLMILFFEVFMDIVVYFDTTIYGEYYGVDVFRVKSSFWNGKQKIQITDAELDNYFFQAEEDLRRVPSLRRLKVAIEQEKERWKKETKLFSALNDNWDTGYGEENEKRKEKFASASNLYKHTYDSFRQIYTKWNKVAAKLHNNLDLTNQYKAIISSLLRDKFDPYDFKYQTSIFTPITNSVYRMEGFCNNCVRLGLLQKDRRTYFATRNAEKIFASLEPAIIVNL